MTNKYLGIQKKIWQIASMKKMELKKKFSFSAAHFLPRVPEGHKCKNLHGHSFQVTLTIKGTVGEQGWVMDFSKIDQAAKPVIEKLDHSLLNDIPGLENPTSENISLWLWEQLKPALPELYSVEIHESPNSSCLYREE